MLQTVKTHSNSRILAYTKVLKAFHTVGTIRTNDNLSFTPPNRIATSTSKSSLTPSRGTPVCY